MPRRMSVDDPEPPKDGDVDVQMEDALISGTPIRCDIPDDSGKVVLSGRKPEHFVMSRSPSVLSAISVAADGPVVSSRKRLSDEGSDGSDRACRRRLESSDARAMRFQPKPRAAPQLTVPQEPRFSKVRTKLVKSSEEIQAESREQGRHGLKAALDRNQRGYRDALTEPALRGRCPQHLSSAPLTQPRSPKFRTRSRSESRRADAANRSVQSMSDTSTDELSRSTSSFRTAARFNSSLRSEDGALSARGFKPSVTVPQEPKFSKMRMRSRSASAEPPHPKFKARPVGFGVSGGRTGGPLPSPRVGARSRSPPKELTVPRSPKFHTARAAASRGSSRTRSASARPAAAVRSRSASSDGSARSTSRGRKPDFRVALHAPTFVPAKANVPLTEPRAPNFSDSRRARTRSASSSREASVEPAARPGLRAPGSARDLTAPTFAFENRCRSRRASPGARRPSPRQRSVLASSNGQAGKKFTAGKSDLRAHNHALDAAEERAFDARRKAEQEKENFSYFARRTLGENASRRM